MGLNHFYTPVVIKRSFRVNSTMKNPSSHVLFLCDLDVELRLSILQQKLLRSWPAACCERTQAPQRGPCPRSQSGTSTAGSQPEPWRGPSGHLTSSWPHFPSSPPC